MQYLKYAPFERSVESVASPNSLLKNDFSEVLFGDVRCSTLLVKKWSIHQGDKCKSSSLLVTFLQNKKFQTTSSSQFLKQCCQLDNFFKTRAATQIHEKFSLCQYLSKFITSCHSVEIHTNIFLSIKFYVKSILIIQAVTRLQNLPFC